MAVILCTAPRGAACRQCLTYLAEAWAGPWLWGGKSKAMSPSDTGLSKGEITQGLLRSTPLPRGPRGRVRVSGSSLQLIRPRALHSSRVNGPEWQLVAVVPQRVLPRSKPLETALRGREGAKSVWSQEGQACTHKCGSLHTCRLGQACAKASSRSERCKELEAVAAHHTECQSHSDPPQGSAPATGSLYQ